MSAGAGKLQRSVGFYGLMFVSLGSIIGSGWLLGALNAAEKAGPASILSWLLAAGMLALLALVYAELGATYPVAGGGAMGIDWMNREEVAQAIPPVYTEFIGRQLMAHLVGDGTKGVAARHA